MHRHLHSHNDQIQPPISTPPIRSKEAGTEEKEGGKKASIEDKLKNKEYFISTAIDPLRTLSRESIHRRYRLHYYIQRFFTLASILCIYFFKSPPLSAQLLLLSGVRVRTSPHMICSCMTQLDKRSGLHVQRVNPQRGRTGPAGLVNWDQLARGTFCDGTN